MDFLDQFDAVLGLPVGTVAVVVMALCGICAVIARFLAAPGSGDSPLYRFFYAAINLLAQNAGRAANADDVANTLKTTAATGTAGTSAVNGTGTVRAAADASGRTDSVSGAELPGRAGEGGE